MHCFKDAEGREWALKLTLASERDVHDETDVYLSDVSGDNPAIGRLRDDPRLLGGAIWALCKKQVKEAGLTETEFLDAFNGQTVADATLALRDEVLDFLGDRGSTVRKVMNHRERIESELQEKNLKGLEEMTGDGMFDLLTKALAGYTDTPGSAEGSAESIPETSA